MPTACAPGSCSCPCSQSALAIPLILFLVLLSGALVLFTLRVTASQMRVGQALGCLVLGLWLVLGLTCLMVVWPRMPGDLLIPVMILLLAPAFAMWRFLAAGYRDADRRKAVAAWARSQGLSFRAGKDGQMGGRYPKFRCLNYCDDCYAYNIAEGVHDGRIICAFDYYYPAAPDTAIPNNFSAVIVETGLLLKPLFIRPVNVNDKVAQSVGINDIDFESAEFRREFYVASPDPRCAFDVLHQATIEFLLGSPRFHLNFEGAHIIAYRDVITTFAVEDFQAALRVLCGILDRLPKSVIHELKG